MILGLHRVDDMFSYLFKSWHSSYKAWLCWVYW